MIETVHDLLNQILEKEIESLKNYNEVSHPVLIGNMYEGLTKKILNEAIFKGLNLKVKAGLIRDLTNKLSDEIDCMLVIGEGEQLPNSDKYIYTLDKVIAIIQVKKNLYTKEIDKSFQNLNSVIKSNEFLNLLPYHYKMAQDAYKTIAKTLLEDQKELQQESLEKQKLFYSFLYDAFYPLRIVWGFNGFKSEF